MKPPWEHLTYRESHAFLNGLYAGYRRTNRDSDSPERHYWRTGYVVGHATREMINNASE